MDKYAQLTHDLKAAHLAAIRKASSVDEAGTMNHDTAGAFLPHWIENKVKEAAKAAGFFAVKTDGRYLGKTGYFTFCRSCGIGNRRSAYAEAITAELDRRGYDVHCYQESD